jgi:transposase
VKTAELEEALRGFFTDHHAVMLRMMLDNIDRISQITALDGRIAEAVAPFSDRVDRLVDLPGVDRVAAAELIGEIGVDTSWFPTAAHLVSWAKFCPQTHQSAGKRSPGRATEDFRVRNPGTPMNACRGSGKCCSRRIKAS